MKKVYPFYKKRELLEVKKGISNHNKNIIKDFLKYCSITAGDSKLIKIERVLLQLSDIMEKDLDKLSQDDINSFLSLLNKSNRTSWTKREIKVYVKKFLKWKYRNLDMIENFKLERSSFNQQKINKSNLLTIEEIEKLLRSADTLKNKAWLMASFESGARPQEIRFLKWKDITFKDSYAEITLFSGKKKESRTVPVKEALIHLKRWKQEYQYPNVRNDDYVFPSPFDRKKAMSINSFDWIIKQLSKKAGIQKNTWNYLLRHSRLNYLYSKLPEQIHKKFAGHSKDSRMTAVYSHLDDADVKELMLEKIFHVEEITKEQQNKYDQEIALLKKDNSEMKKSIEELYREVTGKKIKII